MNRYGTTALETHRSHRPTEHAQISDPTEFFERIGQEIQAEVTNRRDEILGARRPTESIEDYRLRSYQALATAEELTLAEHPLLQPEGQETDEDHESSPAAQELAQINVAIHTAS